MPDGAPVVIMIDAEGLVTEDPRRAVRGEIQQTASDGTTEVTLFEVDPNVAAGR